MEIKDHTKIWIAVWEKANTSLNSIKIQELKSKNYYLNNREILNSMLQYAFDKRSIRMSSGLVNQQKIFKQLYTQSMNASQ